MAAIKKINTMNQLKGSFDLLLIGVNQNNKKLSFPLGVPVETQEDLKVSFSIEEDISKKSNLEFDIIKKTIKILEKEKLVRFYEKVWFIDGLMNEE